MFRKAFFPTLARCPPSLSGDRARKVARLALMFRGGLPAATPYHCRDGISDMEWLTEVLGAAGLVMRSPRLLRLVAAQISTLRRRWVGRLTIRFSVGIELNGGRPKKRRASVVRHP